VNVETTEKTIVTLSKWVAELLEQADTSRRLVLSMALGLSAEEMPFDERELLEEILETT
jgi:hypothetical protein